MILSFLAMSYKWVIRVSFEGKPNLLLRLQFQKASIQPQLSKNSLTFWCYFDATNRNVPCTPDFIAFYWVIDRCFTAAALLMWEFISPIVEKSQKLVLNYYRVLHFRILVFAVTVSMKTYTETHNQHRIFDKMKSSMFFLLFKYNQ